MESLRLGLVGLPEAEKSLLATLFRLHSVDSAFIWVIASEPPFDALLADKSVGDEELEPLKDRHTPIKKLTLPDAAGKPEEMARPIRSDILLRWLNSIEVGILHGGQSPFATTLRETQWPHTLPPPIGEVTRAKPVLSGHFRLRKWPKSSLLGGDVGKIRLATMLSRRPISSVELSAACRLPESACISFMQELDAAGLLERAQAPISIDTTIFEKVVVPAVRDASSDERVSTSLLRSIRKRFGFE